MIFSRIFPGTSNSEMGLKLFESLVSVFGFGNILIKAVLNFEGKYPSDKVWLNNVCNLVIATSGIFLRMVLLMLVSPGVLFLNLLIISVISSFVISESVMFVP